MASGVSSWFTWKDKATREREEREYAAWAFPYGQDQRDNLEALLTGVFPSARKPMPLVQFLTCREMYEGALEKTGSCDAAINEMIVARGRYKHIIGKKELPALIAVVLANSEIDERCIYPSVDEVKLRALEIENLLKKK